MSKERAGSATHVGSDNSFWKFEGRWYEYTKMFTGGDDFGFEWLESEPAEIFLQSLADIKRITELENENSVLVSNAAGCLNDNIIDWVVCGMATNGRLKEEWAITHLIKLKEFKKSLEGKGE